MQLNVLGERIALLHIRGHISQYTLTAALPWITGYSSIDTSAQLEIMNYKVIKQSSKVRVLALADAIHVH